jgi:hypothetical protein
LARAALMRLLKQSRTDCVPFQRPGQAAVIGPQPRARNTVVREPKMDRRTFSFILFAALAFPQGARSGAASQGNEDTRLRSARIQDADRRRLNDLATTHRRAKAQLSQTEISDLDFLRTRAQRALDASRGDDLVSVTLRSVNATLPGLSEREARAITDYVLADLASQPSADESFSLQYLALQQRQQNESRSYTTVSNILKTKHDTVKNSINNVR